MKASVALMPVLAGDTSKSVCVVIDALRATTCVVVLFDSKCPRVYVAGDHATAREYARSRGFALCGESDGFRVEGFDYGNSPTEFAALDFTGKPAVLSTTNGTKAVNKVATAPVVLLGAVTNLTACVEAAWHAADERELDIVFVCSGTDDEFTLEDTFTAGLMAEHLAKVAAHKTSLVLADSALAARKLVQGEPNLIRGWMSGVHARRLCDRGFGDDVAFCARQDISSVVPVLVREREADMVAAPVLLAG